MKNLCPPEIYVKAWDFATRKHDGQTYGSVIEGEKVPYINHVASVAMEVSYALAMTTEEIDASLAVQCALLHDTIEDTNTSFDELENIFGKPVASGVLALSKNAELPSKQAQMVDSLQRIKLEPKEIWMVKLADRITNLSEPPFYWDDDKKGAYQVEAQLILNELGSSNKELASRLECKISEYSKYIGSGA